MKPILVYNLRRTKLIGRQNINPVTVLECCMPLSRFTIIEIIAL